MRTRAAPMVRAAVVVCIACGRQSVSAPAVTSLGGDAARVGSVTIPMSLVVETARSRELPVRRALDGLVEDALLAQAARVARLDSDPSVDWLSTATVARLVPERLYEQARQRGAPLDDELAKIRVIHAIVLRSPALHAARGLEMADVILRAVTGARSDEDFEARIKALPHPGAQVVVERLPEFDATGRTAEGSEFDATFAAAAFGLRTPGETSGIVETPFGWHLIRLIERAPPDAASLPARRDELRNAVVEMRARSQLTALIHADRKRTPVEVSGAADELMAEAARKP